MSHVRHILQSVEMPAATNARASGDYIHPGPGGGHQWDIGTTSILTHAVGLAASKDNYWSTSHEAGESYGTWGYEPHSRLQSAVLSFSAGPVAPSDGIGASHSEYYDFTHESIMILLNCIIFLWVSLSVFRSVSPPVYLCPPVSFSAYARVCVTCGLGN